MNTTSSCGPSENLNFLNIINNKSSVWGIAMIEKGFVAYKHRHEEAETYYFLRGTGKLAIGGKTEIVESPCVRYIPSNVLHAMTPVTESVLLLYSFSRGPYEKIDYQFTRSHL